MSQAKENEVVEVGGRPEENPQRYQRYKKCLGKGAFKVVYEAFDTEDGNLVAWNQVDRGNLEGKKYEEFRREVLTLEKLDHPHIIKLTDWWESEDKSYVVFITELMTSGDLKKFIRRNGKINLKAMRKWAKQILRALDYLHTQCEQPIVHRDIKCDNIFINGNLGEVKLGDLGLSTMMTQTHAVSVLGTPEFMAPEMYEETYNQSVDIYAFGMCMLEIFTGQYPYEECQNPGQIFMKVSKGEPPKALLKLENVAVKHFIESCLAPAGARPTARELLEHELLVDLNESEAGAGAAAKKDSSSAVGTPTTAGPIDAVNGGPSGAAAADAASMASTVPPLQDGAASSAGSSAGGAAMHNDSRRASESSVTSLQSDAGVKANSSSSAPLPEADTGPAAPAGAQPAAAAAAVAGSMSSEPSAAGVAHDSSAAKLSNSFSDAAAAGPIAIMDTTVQAAAQGSEAEAIVIINAQIDGKQKKIQFEFNPTEDLPSEVASDLVEELMDNQAKGLVPPSGPQRDQFIEKIKADFSSSIGNALEKAVAAGTIDRRPAGQGGGETVQASTAAGGAAGAPSPERTAPSPASSATVQDGLAAQGAGSATAASAGVPSSEVSADSATAGNPNPYPGLGVPTANSELGASVVQPETKTEGLAQAASQAHGNQAAAEGPSQMNPPAAAAEGCVTDVAGEQAAATQTKRTPVDDKPSEHRQIEEWFDKEKAKVEREYDEKVAELQRDKMAKLGQLEKEKSERLARAASGAGRPSSETQLPASLQTANSQSRTPSVAAQGASPGLVDSSSTSHL